MGFVRLEALIDFSTHSALNLDLCPLVHELVVRKLLLGEALHILKCLVAYPLNRAAFMRSSRVIPPVKAQVCISNVVLVRLNQVDGGRVLQPRQLAGLVCFLIRKKSVTSIL